MGVMAKRVFRLSRLWSGSIRRILKLYYWVILGKMGSGCNIARRAHITHPYNLFLGDQVTVNEYAIIQCSPDASVTIGSRVAISHGATILTAARTLDRGWFGRKHGSKPVVIEDDVWIAVNAVILPGVRIGARSVVAAGAVVTRDVECNTVVAGVPAKRVRELKPDLDQ